MEHVLLPGNANASSPRFIRFATLVFSFAITSAFFVRAYN